MPLPIDAALASGCTTLFSACCCEILAATLKASSLLSAASFSLAAACAALLSPRLAAPFPVGMQIEKIRKQRSQRSKQLYSFRRKIQGPEKEKFAQILSELTKENEQKILQAKAVYREYLQNKKQAVRYTELQDKLADEDHSLLIYSRQIPRLLNRSCRINGTQPVRSLQIIGYMGDSYALLNQPGQHETVKRIFGKGERGQSLFLLLKKRFVAECIFKDNLKYRFC